ncbi:HlyD family efflux transporter periplasmic adaptor subunit, partial [bacterium]|nr:HlyD family efflux transporter periplasmic adaptor subunit [bacterium]
MNGFSVLATVRRLLGHPAALVVALALAFVIGLWIGGGNDPSATATGDGPAAAAASGDGGEADGPQVYTCSMHPSVRLVDPDAKCPICFMDLIPVQEGSGGPGGEDALALDEDAVARAGIETSAVARFFPEAEVRLYGKLVPDETRVARLTAWFPGRIERLFVNYLGVPIGRGEHVADLYSPELLTAFAELREAAGSASDAAGMSPVVRRSSRGVLEAARQRLRLLGVDEEAIEAAESGRFDEDRFTVTSPIGGVVTDLAAREGDYLDTGDPIATVADLSRLWLDLEAYESQLAKLAWGQRVTFTVESRPGDIFEGRIAFIEPLVDERTRTAAVRIAVDNADRQLKPGMFASATVRMRVDDGGVVLGDELAGRWVAPMHPTIVEDGPGTCEICGMDLVPAESLGVVAGTGSGAAAATPPLVIPRSAVMFTGERSIVYVQVPDAEMPTFTAREVLIGPRAGDFVTVRDGLEVGERVVTRGAFRIDSDMQIAAKPSMMMPSTANAPAEDPEVPSDFTESLAELYTAYLALQEALADDDLEAARTAAGAVRSAVDVARAETLVGAPLADWRRLRPQL